MKRRQAVPNGVRLASLLAAALVFGSCSRKDPSHVGRPGGEGTDALPIAGEYYEAEVPDTLDLAERTSLGLHYFTEIMDEDLGYEMYFGGYCNRSSTPYAYAHVTSLGACQNKALEAMVFERVISGSTLHLDREAKMIEMMASFFGEDGLHWVSADITKKPWMKIGEPFVMVHGQGRIMRAMIALYQYTGDPIWKERIDKMVEGLEKIVVHKDDYAYIPVYGFYEEEYLRSCYTKEGWKDTVEPTNEKFGEEGSLFNHQGHIPGALATWYELTGNKHALRLSGQLVRFYSQPKFWADFEHEYPKVIGAEHAHWQGHLHGHINTLRAILEYALAANDQRLKQFVRDGYEWARQGGFARIGYVGDGQGCATGRMIGIAVKLSQAGIGDYWEDVDQYIRNHGVAMQFTPDDKEFLLSLGEGKPAPPDEPDKTTNNVVDRIMGGFAGNPNKGSFYLCCGTHGNMGLFYAADATVRYQGGTARVNLLLNRSTPWLDVDSHLPYEGKVVLKNKQARAAFVRIPLWVDRAAVRAEVDGQQQALVWFDNYLRFDGLRPGGELTIRFPMVEKTEQWTIPRLGGWKAPDEQVHSCKFKGNTLVEISPPLVPGSPLYQRSHYLQARAPMKKVTRFATPAVIRW